MKQGGKMRFLALLGNNTKNACVVCAGLLILVTGCQTGSGIASGRGGRTIQIDLDAQKTGHAIADTLYGIFFEDINYAADGGLYPELVRNRSFEHITPDPKPVKRTFAGWALNYGNRGDGSVAGASDSPLFPSNPTYAAVTVRRAPYVIANRGYAAVPDMPLAEGAVYNFYFYARNKDYNGAIICTLENGDGGALANTVRVTPDSAAWKKYGPYTFTAAAGGTALLALRCEGTGSFDLDFVSLMPADTWGGGNSTWPRGGLRKDLAQALADLRPGFIRFPGGCIVEGAYRHETAYNWKDTIGPVEQRKENSNLWGYMMSYGLGFHEYFQLCEDLGAEPVPVLNAGILCQARNDSTNTQPDYRPGTDEFRRLVQDYLDLIEYANGSDTSVWGAKRAANGHSGPFNLRKIGVGNENWGANYWRNFKAIRAAILEAYPQMEIITTTGPLASGWINDEAWRQINLNYTDAIVDEHYYMEPEWFLSNVNRYDSYRRNGVRIFAGEYAAHERSRGNTWYTALCEASYMTGLERNADIVRMSSYAPLFGREGMYQWMPDLIWFDGGGITNLTPNYQIQKLFSNNTGTRVLPPEKAPAAGVLFHASSIDGAGLIYTKLVNPYSGGKNVTLNYANVSLPAEVRVTVLSGKLPAGNSPDGNSPAGALPAREAAIDEFSLPVEGASVSLNLAPYSAAVIRVQTRTDTPQLPVNAD
jgi:alpha-L-arabinofuranosidase